MSITLDKLNARLLQYHFGPPETHPHAENLSEADGVWFLCPKCYAATDGGPGTHGVLCWFVGVPDSVSPNPGRWSPSGTGLDDLTLQPSVQLLSGCRWHGFVTNGAAE